MLERLIRNRFLFEELVKRDFKKKYKRTVLGMFWSILAPLLQLLVMSLVFKHFFGRTTQHFTIYLFCGVLVFSYYTGATGGGMRALVGNASIFKKVDVPKYLFLFSRNVQEFINFCLTLVVLFIFVLFEPGLTFRWKFLFLVYPIVTLTLLNIGVGMVLSALFIFFRDTEYLYSVFTRLLLYMSAIFYNVKSYPLKVQHIFYLNPVYVHILYFREIILEDTIPSFGFHLLCAFYALILLALGCWVYKKYNWKFLYYV